MSSLMPLARPYLAMIWAAIIQHRTPMRDTTRIRKGLVFIRQVEGALRWLHALTSATGTDAVGLRRCFRLRPSAPGFKLTLVPLAWVVFARSETASLHGGQMMLRNRIWKHSARSRVDSASP